MTKRGGEGDGGGVEKVGGREAGKEGRMWGIGEGQEGGGAGVVKEGRVNGCRRRPSEEGGRRGDMREKRKGD